MSAETELAPPSSEGPAVGGRTSSVAVGDEGTEELADVWAGVEVRDSSVPGAGQGLFARRDAPEGAVLGVYRGTRYGTREAIRVEDKGYLMRLGPQAYVDAREHM